MLYLVTLLGMRLIFSMFLMKHNACIYQTDLISPVSEIKMVIWGLSRSLELFYQQYESFSWVYNRFDPVHVIPCNVVGFITGLILYMLYLVTLLGL
jgi:hypothetical protein